MDSNASDPLAALSPASAAPDEVRTEDVEPDEVDPDEVRAALDAPAAPVRHRGIEVCGTLATGDVDAVRPFIDDVAPLAASENPLTARRAIGVLTAAASEDPASLDAHLDPVVDAVAVDHADVRLAAVDLLATLAVERPRAVAPHVDALTDALRDTESDPTPDSYADVVDDPVSRRALRKQDAAERNRRTGARRTLANVVVAVAEQRPEDAAAVVDHAPVLFDDADHRIAGSVVDAVGELAAADVPGVDATRDPLRDILNHDSAFVRVRAVRALGHLGDRSVVGDLRDLAAADDDDTVRDLAGTTADFLADQ